MHTRLKEDKIETERSRGRQDQTCCSVSCRILDSSLTHFLLPLDSKLGRTPDHRVKEPHDRTRPGLHPSTLYRLRDQEAKILVIITCIFLLLLFIQSTLWGKCVHMFKKTAMGLCFIKTLVGDVTREGLAASTAQKSQVRSTTHHPPSTNLVNSRQFVAAAKLDFCVYSVGFLKGPSGTRKY